MKIKRFFAADMRGAIRQVRDAQGPDAVILSTRSVEGGVEIISAIDFDESAVADMVASSTPPAGGAESGRDRPTSAAAGESQTRGLWNDDEEDDLSWDDLDPVGLDAPGEASVQGPSPSERGSGSNVVWMQDPAIVQMQREIKDMKSLLQDQLSQLVWNDFSQREPLRAQLVGRLEQLGFDHSLAGELARAVNQFEDPDKAWREALALLVRRLRTSGGDPLSQGGVVALVGPTGVGKTTTVAKLAARYALKRDPSGVALVTTDAYRVGAQKQLLTYGRILDVPVHVVSSESELTDTLRRVSDRDLVLIDTAGMSQRDLRLSSQLNRLTTVADVRSYLVVSANTQRVVLDDVVRAFDRSRLSGCILTKVDEAVTLGDALSVMIRHQLPAAYIADGQQVPEDLHLARGERLVRCAVALGRRFQGDTRDAPTAAVANSLRGER